MAAHLPERLRKEIPYLFKIFIKKIKDKLFAAKSGRRVGQKWAVSVSDVNMISRKRLLLLAHVQLSLILWEMKIKEKK